MRQPSIRLASSAVTLTVALAACGAATAAGPSSKPSRPVQPARCPARPPARVAANPWSEARAQLAPAGASELRLCRYSRVPSHLVKSVLIGGHGTVRSLVRQFDRLPSFKGTYSCPFDDGSQILALLAYPGGHRVAIDVHLQGCNPVSNGEVIRTALGRPGQPGPALLARLERVTS